MTLKYSKFTNVKFPFLRKFKDYEELNDENENDMADKNLFEAARLREKAATLNEEAVESIFIDPVLDTY